MLPAGTSWSKHYIVNSLLKVTGDTAIGHFYLLLSMQPKTPNGAPKAPPVTAYGRYTDKFVRTETGWKFREVIAVTPSSIRRKPICFHRCTPIGFQTARGDLC